MEGKNNKTKAARTYIKRARNMRETRQKRGTKRENKLEECPKIFLEH